MTKQLRILIPIASGSNDSEVILTASYLRENNINVVIASTEGWGAVNLLCGLTIKPDCSLDRALLDNPNRNIFDLLFLPDGDAVSVGRISNHLKLQSTVRALCKNPYYVHRLKKINLSDIKFCSQHPHQCIVVSGGSVTALYKWGILSVPRPFANYKCWYESMQRWFFTDCLRGTQVTSTTQFAMNREVCDVIVCSSSKQGIAVDAVAVCLTIAEYLCKCQNVLTTLSIKELLCRNVVKQPTPISKSILDVVLKLGWLPTPISHMVKSTIAVCNRMQQVYIVDYESRKNFNKKENNTLLLPSQIYGDNEAEVVRETTKFMIDRIWNFALNSLQMKSTHRRSVLLAAILVTNRVDERLLVAVAAELSRQYHMLIQLIACDRVLLRTNDPYITTNGFFYIRSDQALERCQTTFDVIITIDSDIYPIGTRIWCQNDLFPSNSSTSVVSCMTGNFGDSTMNISSTGEGTISRFKSDKDYEGFYAEIFRKQLDLLAKSDSREGNKETKFHRTTHKEPMVEFGAMYRTFEALQVDSDVRAIANETNKIRKAKCFAKSISQSLELIMIKKGYTPKNITKHSHCALQ